MLHFDNIVYNLILIVGIVIFFVFINAFLNAPYRKYAKIPSKMNQQVNLAATEFAGETKIGKVDVIPTSTSPDFDVAIIHKKSVFLNARDYYGKSVSSIGYALALTSLFHFAAHYPKKHKIYYIMEPIISILCALSWGAILIGLLLQLDILILIGIIIIFISLFYHLYFFRYIRKIQNTVIVYCFAKTDEKEMVMLKKLYKYYLIIHILKPFLYCVKLFPFLLPKNQKAARFSQYKNENNK